MASDFKVNVSICCYNILSLKGAGAPNDVCLPLLITLSKTVNLEESLLYCLNTFIIMARKGILFSLLLLFLSE